MALQLNYHIGAEDGDKLYILEERLSDYVHIVAQERIKWMPEGTEHWGEDGAVAQVLHDLLCTYEKPAAKCAVKAYMELHMQEE